MKISDAIALLCEVLEKEGDLHIKLADWNEDYREPFPLRNITVEEMKNEKFVSMGA